MRLWPLSLLPLLLALTFSSSFATRHERTIEGWRPLNYNVTLTLDDRLTEITRAHVEITIQILKDDLRIVDLDFGDLAIDKVTSNGRPAVFDRTPGLLNVALPSETRKGTRVVVAVDYHGKPKDGLVMVADKDKKPSATGDNWPNRVHHWIPCFDHPSAKATVTFTITAPARDLVVANGKFEQVRDDSATTRTWTYSETVPIPAYCMVIAVGDFAKFVPTTPALTSLSFYVPQSDAPLALQGFTPAAPAVTFFSQLVAPYPYEKLALIVGATRYGGMENSSAIVFASSLLTSGGPTQRMSKAFNVREGLEGVIAHEIAHQWFGDSVTESTWSDLWLSEGFATYFAGLFVQKHDGEEAFRVYMKRAADSYFAFEKQSPMPIHDTETEDLMKLLNANNYQKGAWVLHMLRSRLGDDAFFRGLKLYYNAHKESTADSDDLRAALEKASGKNLKEFFARWIYGTGHPVYRVEFGTAEYSGAGGTLIVTLKQLQSGEIFSDPVPIDVLSGSSKRRLWIEPTSRVTTAHFRFTRNDVPTDVVVDPDGALLKEVVAAAGTVQISSFLNALRRTHYCCASLLN
jgi:aminopeptidase N